MDMYEYLKSHTRMQGELDDFDYRYESPIHMFVTNFNNQVALMQETNVLKAVVGCGVTVDKEELIRALQYDRGQYEKGYEAGRRSSVKHGRWVDDKCTECGSSATYAYGNAGSMFSPEEYGYYKLTPYCPNCGAKML